MRSETSKHYTDYGPEAKRLRSRAVVSRANWERESEIIWGYVYVSDKISSRECATYRNVNTVWFCKFPSTALLYSSQILLRFPIYEISSYS